MAGAESEAGEGEGEGPEPGVSPVSPLSPVSPDTVNVVGAPDPPVGPREGSPEPIDWWLPLSFTSPRHTEAIEAPQATDHTWRIKEKYKTHCVALVVCLNIGVDPPDIVKTQPCARLECWIDPLLLSPAKSLELIGNNLQLQYERWQPRARYKQSLDPTSDEVKKLCCSLRRNAKDERVLFHYNGHGVPKPTSQGEIWVFNKAFTQYIPLSIYDLQTWMGAPSLYVYDCSNAGVIVDQFKMFAEQHEKDYEMAKQNSGGSGNQSDASSIPQGPPSYKNCIQLAACAANQILPMNPELPADLFTSCLTTPIKMALKWFVMQNHPAKIIPQGTIDLIDKIPGLLTDRRSMMGELNWIFTAITDTIAWNTLPRDLFQQLFRADLLTASLCRNFLLADKILRCYNCTPVCSPAMPSTAGHPMWQAWEHTLDLALAQLPAMLNNERPYVHSLFFEEQLTAFQVWLDLGSPQRSPPDQLPMVLQVLLSTMHRVRALEILGKFLALGPWAVNLILNVGIFPYMVKLLQTSSRDLRPLLVFIWAKIMAVDGTGQVDLVNAKGHKYFIAVLQDTNIDSSRRTMAAFVLAGIVNNYSPGQEAALQGSLVSICLEQLNEPNPLLRQWLAICLGRLWHGYDQARWSGARDMAHEKLYRLLEDPVPEVRAAAVYALGTFISSGRERTEHANNLDQQVALHLTKVTYDMSPIVRAELLAALQWHIFTFEPHFIAVSLQESRSTPQSHHRGGSRERNRMNNIPIDTGRDVLDTCLPPSPAERMKRVSSSSSISSLGSSCNLQGLPTIGFGSAYMTVWSILCYMSSDPHPHVAEMANKIVNYIKNQAIELSLSREFYGDSRFGGNLNSSGNNAGSSSLPPSPNTRGIYIHEHSRTLPLPGHNRKPTLPVTISEDAGTVICNKGSSVGDSNFETTSGMRKPIVTTQFVQWASSHFAGCSLENQTDLDIESRMFQEKKWRYQRNKALRKEAREEQKMPITKLETQVFNTRSPLPPSVIIFHPYDQHIAVAAKESFGIWDWGTGAKLCYGQWKGGAKLTALQYVNAHDIGRLLLCGASCGSVALYQATPTTSPSVRGTPREPRLVTAWRALGDPQSQLLPHHMSKATGPGLVMEWQQHSQTLLVAGTARCVRLWDACTERKYVDISTEAECAATCVSRHNKLAACGFVDGSLRIWDTYSNKLSRVLRDHQAPLIQAFICADGRTLVSGCEAGEIRIYDLRKNLPLSCIQTSQGMTAMAVHQYEDVLACGFSNQYIGIFNKNAILLNTIRFREGFMGPRIGPVSCLSFHPERCSLAVGVKDSTISVYSTDSRR